LPTQSKTSRALQSGRPVSFPHLITLAIAHIPTPVVALLFALILPSGATLQADQTLPPACLQNATRSENVIARVSDGDTIVLANNRRVRLIGINTPELNARVPAARAMAEQAKMVLMQLLPAGEPVVLFMGAEKQDRHKRLLAHVMRKRDSVFVADELINRGLAAQSAVAPNTACAEHYSMGEQVARSQGSGLWPTPAWWLVDADEANYSKGGFQIVTGTVTRIVKQKKRTRVQLDNSLWLNVRSTLAKQLPIHTWDGKQITVRGWLGGKAGKRELKLHHRANMSLVQ